MGKGWSQPVSAGQRLPSGCLHSSVANQRLRDVQPHPGAEQRPRFMRADASQYGQGSQAAARTWYCSWVTVGTPAATHLTIAEPKFVANSTTVGSLMAGKGSGGGGGRSRTSSSRTRLGASPELRSGRCTTDLTKVMGEVRGPNGTWPRRFHSLPR